jgi:hypothetical protein
MPFESSSKFFTILTTDKRLKYDEFSLKRKRIDDEDLNISKLYDDINEPSIIEQQKKHIKNDVLLSSVNCNMYCNKYINQYSSPLLTLDTEKYEHIKSKTDFLYKCYSLHIQNCKTLNDNIETVYNYNIEELNTINTKMDIINTKINRLEQTMMSFTQNMLETKNESKTLNNQKK